MYTTCSLRPSNTCCGKQRIRSSDTGHGIDLLGTPRPVVAVSGHFDDKTLALTVTTITVTLHLHHAAFQLRRTLSRVPVEVLSNLQDGIEGRETGWERQRRTWCSRWFRFTMSRSSMLNLFAKRMSVRASAVPKELSIHKNTSRLGSCSASTCSNSSLCSLHKTHITQEGRQL